MHHHDGSSPQHTDSAAQNKNGTIRLQQPFDPIPRTAPRPSHRASASPSIASLINVDDSQPKAKQAKISNLSPTSSGFYVEPSANKESEKAKSPETATDMSQKPMTPTTTTNNDLNNTTNNTISTTNNIANNTTNNTSGGSPKSSRPTVPVGSNNSLLLPGFSANPDDELRPPNICLHVPLNGEQNKYVNFAKLAEERYGWAALNPRLARAKLQMDSGDETMVDGSESESNVEMTGLGETTEDPKKRQKRKYQDVYDKEDPFIDDSEMLWEEQAAASKDGFFVYSGPLVPEGEKPQIERADGTVKRGRGRGRGSRGGSTAARGAGTTGRKPRITKKEKEKLEKEKEERERFSVIAAAQAGRGLQPAAK